MLFKIIIIIQVLAALAIIVLVLMQHGKGADMGAAFGGGANSTGSVFGATGSSNFLSKSTALAAVVFFLATLGMAYLGPYRAPVQNGVLEKLQATTQPKETPEIEPAKLEATKEAAGITAVPDVKKTIPLAPVEPPPAKK